MCFHLAHSCVFRLGTDRCQLFSSTFFVHGTLPRGGSQITLETTLPDVNDREL